MLFLLLHYLSYPLPPPPVLPHPSPVPLLKVRYFTLLLLMHCFLFLSLSSVVPSFSFSPLLYTLLVFLILFLLITLFLPHYFHFLDVDASCSNRDWWASSVLGSESPDYEIIWFSKVSKVPACESLTQLIYLSPCCGGDWEGWARLRSGRIMGRNH